MVTAQWKVRNIFYRVTRDGFNASVFDEKCDGTVTCGKLEYYNGCNFVDTKAFILSVRKDGVTISKMIKNAKLSKVNNKLFHNEFSNAFDPF